MDLASEKRDRRPYRLARKGGALVAIPEIETPEEDNARTGFLELAQFDAIIAHLPTELRAPIVHHRSRDFRSGARLGDASSFPSHQLSCQQKSI